MLIGIDASPVAKEKKTGIEWYCYHIINELTKLDSNNKYKLYTKSSVASQFTSLPGNFSEVVLPYQRFWTHTALASELKRNPVDLFYSPGHIIPWYHPPKTVSTIHDVGFRHFRKSYSYYQYLHASLNVRLTAYWSSEIIVPSQFVAEDVTALYKLKNKHITVIPNGFDVSEFANIKAAEVLEAKRKYNISKPYFIFVGRMDTRKNLLRTLQAFFKIIVSGTQEIQFVLLGSPGVGYEEIDNFIKAQKRDDLIIRTGYASIQRKAALLSGAKALIFPSLHEGFGIPILEGFAAGVPVLSSNQTSCPEVAGDAAILVDPLDVEAIGAGMKTLLTDEALCHSLVTKGHERAPLYGWKKCAQAVHQRLTNL